MFLDKITKAVKDAYSSYLDTTLKPELKKHGLRLVGDQVFTKNINVLIGAIGETGLDTGGLYGDIQYNQEMLEVAVYGTDDILKNQYPVVYEYMDTIEDYGVLQYETEIGQADIFPVKDWDVLYEAIEAYTDDMSKDAFLEDYGSLLRQFMTIEDTIKFNAYLESL